MGTESCSIHFDMMLLTLKSLKSQRLPELMFESFMRNCDGGRFLVTSSRFQYLKISNPIIIAIMIQFWLIWGFPILVRKSLILSNERDVAKFYKISDENFRLTKLVIRTQCKPQKKSTVPNFKNVLELNLHIFSAKRDKWNLRKHVNHFGDKY